MSEQRRDRQSRQVGWISSCRYSVRSWWCNYQAKLLEGFPSSVLFGHGTKHRHQGAMGVLAVGEGVIEGNAQWLSVHL